MNKKIIITGSTLLVLTSLILNTDFSNNRNLFDASKLNNLTVNAATSSTPLFPEDEHLATNTVHEGIDTVSYLKDKIIIKNGTSEYKIIHDGSDAALKIAGKIKSTTKNLFGFYFDVKNVNDLTGNISSNDKYIIFGTDKNKFSEVFPDETKVKNDGYAIKTVGNCLYCVSYGTEGMNNAYNAFTKVLFGYEPLFEIDVYTYDGKQLDSNTTIYLPNCNIVERPDFYYRNRGQTLSNALIEKMNYERPYEFFYRIGTGTPHNCLNFLPPETYGNSHSAWFTENKKQLCYTAHGDATEKEEMVKTIAQFCKSKYDENPSKNNSFMIGQMDKAGDNQDAYLCTCDSCKSFMNQYKDPSAPDQLVYSSTMIQFFNEVDDYIQTNYNIHDIKLIFFAYQESMSAPYDPSGTFKCKDNVGVFCAPSRASYTHSFYDDMQKNMEKDYPKICRDWGKFTKSLYLWMYQTQFQSVLFPFQTWGSTIDNCRFAHECNGVLLFPEGDEFNNNMTAFGRFKDYLYAKGMYNVNSSYYKLKKFYFEHYYGSAGNIMEKMYDQIVSYLTYLGTKEEGVRKGLITEPPYDRKNYWNKNVLMQWQKMVEDALVAVEADKRLDPANYETYKSHVEIEGVFPNFALRNLFKDDLDATSKKEIAKKVASWCRTYGIQYQSEANKRESITLDNTLFKEWGV